MRRFIFNLLFQPFISANVNSFSWNTAFHGKEGIRGEIIPKSLLDKVHRNRGELAEERQSEGTIKFRDVSVESNFVY